jgi:hypothetical protein
MVPVDAGDGTDAVGREELLFVEHDAEHALQLLGLTTGSRALSERR